MRQFIERLGIQRPADWNERLFFVVVHLPGLMEAYEAAWRETNIAMEAGADGVLLISHFKLQTEELSSVWESVEERLASEGMDFTVGINWLTLEYPEEMVYEAASHGIPLVWSDRHMGEAEVKAAREKTGWTGAYCGAFAFKVGPHVPNDQIPKVLDQAYRFMDVPFTSGPDTGIPLDEEKASVCREAAGDRPLGVISGVSAENIDWHLPYFNVFGAASSLALEGDWYRQDGKKTAELAKRIHAYEK